MSFTLQKVLWFLAAPPACVIFFMVFGLLASRKRRDRARGFLLAGTLVLYLLSIAPVSDFLLKPLERSASPLTRLPDRIDAVVVPGGGSVDRSWLGASPVPNGETLARLVLGIELAKKMDVPLVLLGGNGEPFATTLNDAEVMAETAYAMGVPRHQVVVENRSRNTLENARAARRIVKGDRIILATSAYYMKRAIFMFGKEGFRVTPAPTWYLAQCRLKGAALFIPRAAELRNSSIAVAEWMSLYWWKLRGEL